MCGWSYGGCTQLKTFVVSSLNVLRGALYAADVLGVDVVVIVVIVFVHIGDYIGDGVETQHLGKVRFIYQSQNSQLPFVT